MAEIGSEGYEQGKPQEEQEKVDVEVNTDERAPGRFGRLLQYIRHPRPEADDPRDQPVVTNLLSHISESSEEEFYHFEEIEDSKRWRQKNPQLDRHQEFALEQRLAGEISEEQIHTLATEQIPRLLEAVIHYQLPLKDYQTVLLLAETAAQKADKKGKSLMKKAKSDDFEERVTSAYTLLTEEKIFDAQRLKVASEMLREIITADGIALMIVRKGELAFNIGGTLQYNLFGPETKKLYADYRDRLKASLKYRSPRDGPDEIPYMDEEQIFYEALRKAHQVQEKDQTAQPLKESEQVTLPLEPHPWEVTAIHEDQTATVKGIATPDTTEPVEKKVPLNWLVRTDVVETYRRSITIAA